MNKKTKIGAVVLLAFVCASPVHASDWFSTLINSWFTASGVGNGGGHPSIPDPVYTPTGAGNGGGHPSIPDPVYTPTGAGNGGGNPSIPDPN